MKLYCHKPSQLFLLLWYLNINYLSCFDDLSFLEGISFSCQRGFIKGETRTTVCMFSSIVFLATNFASQIDRC